MSPPRRLYPASGTKIRRSALTTQDVLSDIKPFEWRLRANEALRLLERT